MTMLTRRATLRVVAAAAVLPLATAGAGAEGHAANHTVVIKDFAFVPANITIKAGDTITWVNEGETTHSAWDLNDVFDTGLLSPGQSAAMTFNSAGTFTYRCRPHRTMRGSITITK